MNISGDMCLCGDTGPLDVDPVLALEPSKCTVPCDGDATQTCGSATHVEIYEAVKPVTSMLAAVKNVVQIGETVSLLPNVETAASDWQMRIDYDDGAGPTSYAASPATGLLTRSFRQAGRYSIGAYLTDKDNIIAVRFVFKVFYLNCFSFEDNTVKPVLSDHSKTHKT